MISLNEATLRRGSRVLLEKTSFTIFPGYKVGVVGRNGTGKSSLFALLLGELHTDAGEASMPRNLAIATVAQETPALPTPAIEFALDGDVELRKVERELAIAEEKHDADGIGHGHERLGQIDGYSARARAAQLLRGLGFTPEMQDRAVADFSGGWRMRLNLARALMCRSDLLLLDEPTNHLDLDAVIWLQDYLVEYPGTLLIISHDREFLDTVTTHTLHLERLGATLYSGNYSGFERLRAEKLAQQAATFAQQQLRVAHLQSFITRFKAKASKARQAQSRIKQLERMELIAPAHWDSEFQFEFLEPDRVPSPLLKLDDVRAGYPDRPILSGVKLSLEPGDRIGLLGPNGAGKSTLIRTLAGELGIISGHSHRDPHLRIGYFAQHQLEHLDPKASPLLHFKRLAPQATEQSLRNFLGGFAFVGDRVFEAVEPFSGGEKARLALALVVWQKPNLLLLDEPTNHLDLDMRYALETALQEFGGAMILVSHDRHLLSSTCDEFWRVADGKVQPFDGDLDDYARWLTSGRSAGKSDAPPKERNRANPKDQRKASADERERLRLLREATGKLEKRMAKLQAELAQLEKTLADQDLYSETRRADLNKHLQKQSETKKQLVQVESEWLAASEELETL